MSEPLSEPCPNLPLRAYHLRLPEQVPGAVIPGPDSDGVPLAVGDRLPAVAQPPGRAGRIPIPGGGGPPRDAVVVCGGLRRLRRSYSGEPVARSPALW